MILFAWDVFLFQHREALDPFRLGLDWHLQLALGQDKSTKKNTINACAKKANVSS
jgi:hypothetical protein